MLQHVAPIQQETDIRSLAKTPLQPSFHRNSVSDLLKIQYPRRFRSSNQTKSIRDADTIATAHFIAYTNDATALLDSLLTQRSILAFQPVTT
ncbi:MAG TPA: hypothetical protein DCW57_04070 [Planctomycetaceae bacterium]|nr:hypothetical protein [Planctomycetaceae bacterium]